MTAPASDTGGFDVFAPQVMMRLHLLLDDFGQDGADELLEAVELPIAEYEVERNPHSEADTAELTVSIEDLPLDPQVVRGATVEVYQGASDSLDPSFWSRADLSVEGGLALFVGVVDEMEANYAEGKWQAKLRCRDYTAYFLDVDVDPNPVSFVGAGGRKKTLLEVVEAMVHPPGDDEATAVRRARTAAIEVDDRDGAAAALYPADYMARKDGATQDRGARANESAWEALQEVVTTGGLVAYIEHDRLVLRRPSTLYLPDANADPIVWTLGYDVEEFTTHRNLARQTAVNVLCISYLPSEDRVGRRRIEARWPDPPIVDAKPVAATPGDDSTQAVASAGSITFRPFVVRSVDSESHLREIARQLYERIGHEEVDASFSTRSMTDSLGRSVTTMTYGDTVRVDRSETLRSIHAQSAEERARHLLSIGYTPAQAAAIAHATDRLEVPYYLHRMVHRYSSDSGYECRVEVRARRDVELEA